MVADGGFSSLPLCKPGYCSESDAISAKAELDEEPAMLNDTAVTDLLLVS